MNLLSLWSGHPFGSLVRLDDYPYAVEVSDEQFERNVAMYRYIAEEADKRGIWVVQMFYNILLPAPLAERHHLKTQLAAPTPVAADYTRKAIAEFVRQYPNVGLHVCLGEAMLDVDHQKQWLTEVILPGVLDGMELAGLKEEPPIIIRAHATDPSVVIPAALEVYQNIYTIWKYTGESLTTTEPRGPAQQKHLAMARLGSTHLVNVHILANLEPFRYGAQRFIKRSVLASRDRLGAGGLHIYPLAYWDWPSAPDATDPLLEQIRRDEMWFDAWARYAWNPDIDAKSDRQYWIDRLTEAYGSAEAAPLVLDALNDAGECAPRLVRRVGITEGNRQTLSLGMTLDQLTHPEKYNAYPDLWQSQAPPGERLGEYVRREWEGLPHKGETPPKMAAEAIRFAEQAVASINDAAPLVSKNLDEFGRVQNDIHAIRAMTRHYAAKADAARLVLRYELSGDPSYLRQAAERLEESLAHYRELVRLTDKIYRYANSMQTGHRRIPVRGAVGDKPVYYHWRQVLPVYEKELEDFRQRLARIEAAESSGGSATAEAESVADQETPRKYKAVKFELPGATAKTYRVEPGEQAFSDRPAAIRTVAPALRGLIGIQMPYDMTPKSDSPPVEIDVKEPVTMLIGYFRSTEPGYRQPPNPDFDARAHERGEAEPLMTDAVTIEGQPPVDVYAKHLPAGRSRIKPPGTGRYLVLGVVADER